MIVAPTRFTLRIDALTDGESVARSVLNLAILDVRAVAIHDDAFAEAGHVAAGRPRGSGPEQDPRSRRATVIGSPVRLTVDREEVERVRARVDDLEPVLRASARWIGSFGSMVSVPPFVAVTTIRTAGDVMALAPKCGERPSMDSGRDQPREAAASNVRRWSFITNNLQAENLAGKLSRVGVRRAG